jgi:hypothetical protein
MVDIEEKIVYRVDRKSSTQHGTDNAVEKVKPAARAIEKKLRDPGRDLGAEYNKEKAKERFN